MEKFNKNAVGEAIGRIGCGVLIFTIALIMLSLVF